MTMPAIPTRRAAAAVAPAMPTPGLNMLPLQAGTARRLTPGEEEGLVALGWNKGDPVPGNLADVIASVQAEAATAQLPPGTPSLDPSALEIKEVGLEQLPQAYKELIAKEMHKMAETAESQRAVLPGAGPGVDQAIRDLQQLQQRAAESAKAAVASAYSPPPSQPQPQPQPQIQQRQPPQPALQPEARSPAQPAAPENDPTIAATPRHCPHCEKDIKADAVPNPSDAVKRRYIAATLSDSGRFRDTVTLLNGAIIIGFRTMTHQESSLCRDQIFKDVAAGKYASEIELSYMLNEFRAVCSTDFIRVAGRGELTVPHITDVDGEQPFKTAMDFISMALRDEWAVRYWKLAFRKFDALCDKLFANMGNSDFWPPIG